MLIDWFTVIAQIFNFLILVALLKRFLYRPILKAMDEREAKIVARLNEARETLELAEQKTREYEEKLRELEARRADMLSAASREAEARRTDLLREAREEVMGRRTAWYEALQKEKAVFFDDLRKHAGAKFLQVSRHALGELAGVDLEHRILQVFLERLQKLADETDTDALRSILRTGSQVAVTSSFDIPPELRETLEHTFRSRISEQATFHYERSDALLCGIEIKTDGVRIAWSLQDYLSELEKDLNLEFMKRPVSVPADEPGDDPESAI